MSDAYREVLVGALGKEGAATFGLVTLMMVDHLEKHHALARSEACEELGTTEEAVDMMKLMFEEAVRQEQTED
jgi:hypothetical protein